MAALHLKPRLWDLLQLFIGTNATKKAIAKESVAKPGRVLEIGCATGNIAEAFKDFDYTGIDTVDTSIALARLKFENRPNVKFVAGDLFAQTLAPESFDYVVISHTAHHLPDDYFKRIISHCATLLKQDGKVVIIDMVRPSPDDLPGKRFYYWLDRGQYLRTVNEFEAALKASYQFSKISSRVVECRKLGVRIIDQILVEAYK